MTVCPHAAILCKLHGCEKCAHAEDMAACPHAYANDEADLAPTFAVALEIFGGRSDIATAYRRSVVSSVAADIRAVGLDGGSRVTMMTRDKFKLLVQLLTAKGVAPVTISTRLGMFGALCNEKLETAYEQRGFGLPSFNIPSYKAPPKRPQEVRERDVAKLKKLMGAWAQAGETEMYKAAWFGLHCGMRWGDVCRVTWAVFVQTVDGVFISYTPHKTERSSGAVVSFRIDPEAFLDIEPYIGAKDDFVLTRHGKHAPKGREGGDYGFLHRSLHNRINAAIRECGIGTDANEKRFHALRKRFDTRNAQQVGEREAARMAGHSVEVARRSYIGTAGGRWGQ